MLRAVVAIMVAAGSVAGSAYFGLWVSEYIANGIGQSWQGWQIECLPLITVFPLVALLAIFYRRLWRTEPFKLGDNPVSNGLLGLGVGAAIMIAAAGFALATGHGVLSLDVQVQAVALAFFATTIAILIQVVAEELLFRGWLLPTLQSAWGRWAALILSSSLFSALHLVGGAEHWLTFTNLFLGSMALGLLFFRTGGLIAPIGLHFGYNWSEELLLGITPGGGYAEGRSLMDVDILGSPFFGGGEDGVNASLAVTAGFLLVIFTLILRMRTRKKMPPPAQSKTVEPASAAEQTPASTATTEPPLEASEHTLFVPSAFPTATMPKPQASATTAGIDEIPSPPQSSAQAEPAASSSGVMAKTLTGTHQGAIRSVNEDRLFAAPSKCMWAVADGMGGHRFGDRASTLVVEHLERVDASETLEARVDSLRRAAIEANGAIFAEAQTNGSRMGSTLVACAMDETRVGFVWAGDSRAYRLRGGKLEQMSRDHTQVQELVDRGELTVAEAARHPMSHVLVRAVGVVPEIELDTRIVDILPGDIFFLCSDGIYDALDDSEIVGLLMKRGDQTDLSAMIELAVAQGARDNITAIAIIPGE